MRVCARTLTGKKAGTKHKGIASKEGAGAGRLFFFALPNVVLCQLILNDLRDQGAESIPYLFRLMGLYVQGARMDDLA